ncbi:hypothetical protein Ancab_039945 [Ancistrocladus abbreviatus]
MSTIRRKLNTVSVNLGCSCRKPKLSSIFTPKPKSKLPKYHQPTNQYPHYYSSSTPSSSTQATSSTFSPFMDYPSYQDPYNYDGFGRQVGSKSVAVEKDSSDPYLDFRQSMLQMIVENRIYAKDDLKELLNCFLQLNSPSLHGVIVRAFTEIWNSFFFNGNGKHRLNSNGTSPRVYVRPKSYEV